MKYLANAGFLYPGEYRGECIDVVEDDEQQCNECDNDGNVGSCFVITVGVRERIPGKHSQKDDIEIEKCLKHIDRPFPVQVVSTDEFFETKNKAHSENYGCKGNTIGLLETLAAATRYKMIRTIKSSPVQ